MGASSMFLLSNDASLTMIFFQDHKTYWTIPSYLPPRFAYKDYN